MHRRRTVLVVWSGFAAALLVCVNPAVAEDFPPEIVRFVPYKGNPVFAGTGKDTWDRAIRERGYILREDGIYHLWYTGYKGGRHDPKFLGYATSPDGFVWTRYPGNPIFRELWTEDMQVVKHGDTYYMFAEGRNDVPHLLTSNDRIHWKEEGPLDIRYASGKPLKPGVYGTTTVWIEGPKWYLYYERNDLGIWLATSTDQKVWTNVQDDPVIAIGPELFDRYAVAVNQVIKYKGKYYAYYHASAKRARRDWTTNVAVSTDLVQWKKYPKNPIVRNNSSSGVLVYDGRQFRLYTMHPEVRVHLPAAQPIVDSSR